MSLFESPQTSAMIGLLVALSGAIILIIIIIYMVWTAVVSRSYRSSHYQQAQPWMRFWPSSAPRETYFRTPPPPPYSQQTRSARLPWDRETRRLETLSDEDSQPFQIAYLSVKGALGFGVIAGAVLGLLPAGILAVGVSSQEGSSGSGWITGVGMFVLVLGAVSIAVGLCSILIVSIMNWWAVRGGGLFVRVRSVQVGNATSPDPFSRRNQAVAQPGFPVPSPVQQRRTWLVLGDQPALRWPLDTPQLSVGSALGNDVRLAGLAARHAVIRNEEGKAIFYDLSQGNSWVNSYPVLNRNLLRPGFILRVGPYELLVKTDSQ